MSSVTLSHSGRVTVMGAPLDSIRHPKGAILGIAMRTLTTVIFLLGAGALR
jgi:hypothetical protein